MLLRNSWVPILEADVAGTDDRWAINIEANLRRLPASMREVGEYVLRNRLAAARLDLNALAQETGVSKTTVVRFCQNLGFEGYRDFYAAWVASLSGERGDETPGAPRRTLTETVFHETVQDLTRTLHLADPEAIDRAVRLIQEAPALCFYGLGDSEGVAICAAHRFAILGKPARAITTLDALRLEGPLFATGSVLCAISQSGFHPHVHALEPVRELYPDGERVIAVTSNARSKLARFARTVLLTSASDLRVGKARVTFRACQLAIVDSLAIAFALATRRHDLSGALYERLAASVGGSGRHDAEKEDGMA